MVGLTPIQIRKREGTPSLSDVAKTIAFFAAHNKAPVKPSVPIRGRASARKFALQMQTALGGGLVSASFGISRQSHVESHFTSRSIDPEMLEIPVAGPSDTRNTATETDLPATETERRPAEASGEPRVALNGGRDRPPPPTRSSSLRHYRIICSMQHLLVFLVTVYFILSIELTISWNDISGVHTVASTGQLIPLIIGITSSVRAIQEVILGIVQKVGSVNLQVSTIPERQDADLGCTLSWYKADKYRRFRLHYLHGL